MIPNLVSEWMVNGTVVSYMHCRPVQVREMCSMVCPFQSCLFNSKGLSMFLDFRNCGRTGVYSYRAKHGPRRFEGRKFVFVLFWHHPNWIRSRIYSCRTTADLSSPILAYLYLPHPSQFLWRQTTEHGDKGTMRWMAKELHWNSDMTTFNPRHTVKTDIWAFGMVICVRFQNVQ